MFAEAMKTPQAIASLVQGVLSFLGVLITGGIAIAIWNRNRSKERQDRIDLRAEKRLDLLRALWSDISPVWQGLYLLGGLELRLTNVEERFAQAAADGEDYVPFVSKVAGTLFLNELTEQLVYLETEEIGPVVEFYHQIKTLNQMAEDMRSDRYRLLPLMRRKAVLLDVVLMDNRVMLSAEEALRVIEVALNLPDTRRVAAKRARLSPARLQ